MERMLISTDDSEGGHEEGKRNQILEMNKKDEGIYETRSGVVFSPDILLSQRTGKKVTLQRTK